MPTHKKTTDIIELPKIDKEPKPAPVRPIPIKMTRAETITTTTTPIAPNTSQKCEDKPKENNYLMINVESSIRSRIEHLMISFDDFGPIC